MKIYISLELCNFDHDFISITKNPAQMLVVLVRFTHKQMKRSLKPNCVQGSKLDQIR